MVVRGAGGVPVSTGTRGAGNHSQHLSYPMVTVAGATCVAFLLVLCLSPCKLSVLPFSPHLLGAG